jgi:hypothetical protein
VGCVVDKMPLGQVFLKAFMFSQPIIISPMLHIHLLPGVSTMGPSEATVSWDSVLPYYLLLKEGTILMEQKI